MNQNPEKFAIEFIIRNRHKLEEENNNFARQVGNLAIEALERQISQKWEKIINPYGKLEGFICTCGHQSNSASNYCPNCGRKMEFE